VNEQLINVIIGEIPNAIALIRELFVKKNPDAPVPTDEEVAAAYQEALTSSLARDDRWLAAHPD
jgi:hypothetical protein